MVHRPLLSAEPVRATTSDVCWDPRFVTVRDESYYLAAWWENGSLSEQFLISFGCRFAVGIHSTLVNTSLRVVYHSGFAANGLANILIYFRQSRLSSGSLPSSDGIRSSSSLALSPSW